VDIAKLKKTSGRAAFIALFSVAIPFFAGMYALGPPLHGRHDIINVNGAKHPVPLLTFQLFLGTCMSVTAFPVLARIITEKGLQKLHLGSMTLACAALNDVVAWTLLAVVLAVNDSQSQASAFGTTSEQVQWKPVVTQLAYIVAITIVQFLVVGPLMRLTVLRAYARTGSLSPNRLAWILIGMLLSAWLVHHVGFHAMLGSFLFGLVFPRGHGTPFLHTILSKIEPFATLVLLPLFFMVTGLSIDLSQLSSTGTDLLWILLVASGGKFLGSAIPAKLAGVGWRHSIAIGVMMNTRGLTEIVVLNIAKQANILDDEMFTMLVMMAIITTAAAGPLLCILFPPARLIAEKKADLEERDAAKAQKEGGPSCKFGGQEEGAARIVVMPHDVCNVERLLAAAVATLSPGMRAHLSVARFSAPSEGPANSELGTGLQRTPAEVLAKRLIKEQLAAVSLSRPDLSSAVDVRAAEDPLADALVHIRAVAPQVVVTDWPQDKGDRALLKALVMALHCTVVLWGGGTAPQLPPPEAPAVEEPAAKGAEGAAPAPAQRRGTLQKLRSLRAVLLDEKTQDAAADEVEAKAAELKAALLARVPQRLRRVSISDSADDEGSDADGDAGGAELVPQAPSPRVESADAGAVITPHTMAVAAASALSPKFERLIVSGWPQGERERAELMAFIREVEQAGLARRASRKASMRPRDAYQALRRPSSAPHLAEQTV